MPAATSTLAPNYRDALADALAALTGTRARVIGTGGGCEAMIVGPLDNGTYLWITDDNVGVPNSTECTYCLPAEDGDDPCGHNRGWLVQTAPHHPDVECDRCGDCLLDGPYVHDDDVPWTVEGCLSIVRRALTGDHTAASGWV